MAKSRSHSDDWMAALLADIESQPTVAKSVHCLIAACVDKAKELADLAHHGNEIAAAINKGTAAEGEPLN